MPVDFRGRVIAENPDGYAAYLVVAATKKSAVGCMNFNHITLLDIFGKAGNGSGEHPRMESLERLFFAGFERDNHIIAGLLEGAENVVAVGIYKQKKQKRHADILSGNEHILRHFAAGDHLP